MPIVYSIAAVSPMRREPSHKSEMVSQLLFGEAAEVLEEVKDFTRLKCLYDNYEGWCQQSQLSEPEAASTLQPVGFTALPGSTALLNGAIIQLSLATPVYAAFNFGRYEVQYNLHNLISPAAENENISHVKNIAFTWLNTPYLWGGKSSFGVDCSGFTQQVFKMMGIYIMRDAYQQATQGTKVYFLQEAVCGDLAFFDNEDGRITHVGILLNSEEIIHASGYIKIDRIDEQGIINNVTGERTHILKTIKRMP